MATTLSNTVYFNSIHKDILTHTQLSYLANKYLLTNKLLSYPTNTSFTHFIHYYCFQHTHHSQIHYYHMHQILHSQIHYYYIQQIHHSQIRYYRII